MSKPTWITLIEAAERQEAAARSLRGNAERLRCTAQEGGGHRCTQDAEPLHQHRIDDEYTGRTGWSAER